MLPLSWLKKVGVIPDRQITEPSNSELVEILLQFLVLPRQMSGQIVMKIYKGRFGALVK